MINRKEMPQEMRRVEKLGGVAKFALAVTAHQVHREINRLVWLLEAGEEVIPVKVRNARMGRDHDFLVKAARKFRSIGAVKRRRYCPDGSTETVWKIPCRDCDGLCQRCVLA
jgi:hypothetical protein